MVRVILILCILLSGPVRAEIIVAARTIRPNTPLAASDLTAVEGHAPGAFTALSEIVGNESRTVLYAGHPILPADVGPLAVIDRNELVRLAYTSNGITIVTEGRALSRAGIDEFVRVMNLSSRTTVSGRVLPDGSVAVGP
ncbi:flagellar basal body P-ring formation chaperone FlgA [Pseudooceanicola sp. C21-150M6]|uniref:flagellar basal body P-ring formation chaperone FlgA n=1 Tax=Pseudooceanicola sp. C21-150M6 TaxID=3434355 RepID=UPI003D7FC4A4